MPEGVNAFRQKGGAARDEAEEKGKSQPWDVLLLSTSSYCSLQDRPVH